MEMPPESSSSDLLLETYGEYHLPALRAEPAAADIAASFAARQDGLRTAKDGRIAAERAASATEALKVRAEADVEAQIRRLELAVLGAVDKRRERDPYARMFPANLEGALKPLGAAQAAEGLRLADLCAPATGDALPGLPPDAARLGTELRALCLVLQRRAAADDAAAEAVVAAFSNELSERRRWREQYRKSYGLLIALFSNDARKVEGFFRKPKRAKKPKSTQ